MSALFPERIIRLGCDWSLKQTSPKKRHAVRCLFSHIYCCLLPVYQHCTSCGGSCQYSSSSSNRFPLLTHLPPLCAVLTFKGLVWPQAPWCHALGPEMPSLSHCLSASRSLTLSFFGLAGSAQSSQKSFAGAVQNGLCLKFEHGYADLG